MVELSAGNSGLRGTHAAPDDRPKADAAWRIPQPIPGFAGRRRGLALRHDGPAPHPDVGGGGRFPSRRHDQGRPAGCAGRRDPGGRPLHRDHSERRAVAGRELAHGQYAGLFQRRPGHRHLCPQRQHRAGHGGDDGDADHGQRLRRQLPGHRHLPGGAGGQQARGRHGAGQHRLYGGDQAQPAEDRRVQLRRHLVGGGRAVDRSQCGEDRAGAFLDDGERRLDLPDRDLDGRQRGLADQRPDLLQPRQPLHPVQADGRDLGRLRGEPAGAL